MSVIGAIASGKSAAVEVRKLLEKYKLEYEGKKALDRLNTSVPLRNTNEENSSKNSNSDGGENSHSVNNIRSEIEKYNLFQSCYKCNHCIDNFGCPAMVKVNGKVQIDSSRCNLCGLCIDVCPNNAIRWETEEAINKKVLESLNNHE